MRCSISINEVQVGDVVIALQDIRRGKAFIKKGVLYNVRSIKLIQYKDKGLTDEIGIIFAQKETHWVEWNGKPGLWPLEYFRISYRASSNFLDMFKKKK